MIVGSGAMIFLALPACGGRALFDPNEGSGAGGGPSSGGASGNATSNGGAGNGPAGAPSAGAPMTMPVTPRPSPLPSDCTGTGSGNSFGCTINMQCGKEPRYEVHCKQNGDGSSSCACNTGTFFVLDESVATVCDKAILACRMP